MPATGNEAPRRLLACACLALSMALVGSYVALSKPLVAAIPVFLLAWMRFGIGAMATLHWLRPEPQALPRPVRIQWLLFLESFFGNFLFSICMLSGMARTSAVSAGVILASIPAAVALLSRLLLGEIITGRTWTAIACAIAGMAILGASGHGAVGADDWVGNLLVFAAVWCEAAYAVIGKKLTGAISARHITAVVNLWGLALMTPLGLYQAVQFDFSAPSASIWLLLLFYALAASVWTVWLWMTGLRHVPASTGGVFTAMLPVCAAAVGVLVLGEPFTTAHALAFSLALAGILLATWPTRAR